MPVNSLGSAKFQETIKLLDIEGPVRWPHRQSMDQAMNNKVPGGIFVNQNQIPKSTPKRTTFQIFASCFGAGLLLLVSACSSDNGSSGSGGSNTAQSLTTPPKAAFDANTYNMTKVVCDSTPAISPAHGLLGRLYYQPAGAPALTQVSQIEGIYTQSEQSLFFNDVNVPTRLFTAGFTTASGDLVKNDTGTTLIENFGLVMTSQFQLASGDTGGTYEFALLSDDGATFEMQDASGVWQTVINDDALHPTKMGCSFDSSVPTVQLAPGMIYNLRIHYFQGPRYEIANTLMWRKVDAASGSTRDALCGQSGNYLFFNPDQNSAPEAAYTALLSRGWSVMPAADFYLPTSDLSVVHAFNPCYLTDSPQISGAHVIADANGTVTVTWTTDRPATGQLVIKDASGSSLAISVSDNLLTTDHSVTLSNLPTGISAFAQVISYSSTQGMAMSAPIPITL